MPEGARVTEVEIFGRTYSLVSDYDTDYAREVADLVDRRMSEVANHQRQSDTGKIAIMAALEIADEIMRQRDQNDVDAEAAIKACLRLSECVGREEGKETR